MNVVAERYDHRKVEAKWQKFWADTKAFVAKKGQRDKLYILDMFPYPSGEGLHVGHPRGYVGSDILARYYRLKGFNVLHPMGFDAFGLPAENAAIKSGLPPQESTRQNIKRFKQQLRLFSLSYDWSREINTSDPIYYKWTQWLFLLLYRHGLAYRRKANVNWCPQDKTVLANEQVVDGRCERCGTQVIQKQLTQWFFKITAFAEELLQGLKGLDWPESTKELQRHWIGRSEGYEIDFAVLGQREAIKVFTTRLDTLFGATYLVLAPEHSLAKKLISAPQQKEAEAYLRAAQTKTERERLAEGKIKTGVFTGSYAVNPGLGQKIPIWLADYVLPHYGTGAIMAVPAHDERDFDFAKKFKLPVIRVIKGGKLPYPGLGMLVNSGRFNGLVSFKAAAAIAKKVGGKKKVQYRLRDWLVSRQRYWGAPIPIVYGREGQIIPVEERDLPVLLPQDVDFRPAGFSPLFNSQAFQRGVERKYGRGARRETDTLDTFVDSAWYFLRYADPGNLRQAFAKEKIKKWLPVDLYIGGAEHATGHLIFARFITRVLYKLRYLDFAEPFLKLRHQGLILAPDGQKMSKSRGNVVNPDDLVKQFGADSFRVYEMFLGPFNQSVNWETRGLVGVWRFLHKVWGAVLKKLPVKSDPQTTSALHRLVRKATADLESLKFNTVVSGLMEFFNRFSQRLTKEQWRTFLLLLYPLAPHLSSELWTKLTRTPLDRAPWPTPDEAKLQLEKVALPVQIDSKLRGTVTISGQASEREVLAAIRQDSKLKEKLPARIKRVFYKPGRIINLLSRG